MKISTLVLTSVLLSSLAFPLGAQTQITENTYRPGEQGSAPATLESVAWLAGSWVGTGLGGVVEEAWTAPSGGSMIGSFKLLQEGKPSFYEFLLLVEEEGSLVLRLKHINPDMVGWEEKDEFVSFPLVKVDGDTAYFRGLTYRKVGDDRMKIYLALHSGDEVNEAAFEFERR